jgi:phosphoribosylaminoimidazolecarboxamide formyltransferase/IMP cyclohydrolase
MRRQALLSCWNKDGLDSAAGRLTAAGWDLWASGGTADFLSGKGIPVRSTEEITGMVSLLGGRVKTLHPGLYSAILAAGSDREEMMRGGKTIFDLVAVDFYPFSSCWRNDPLDSETTELIDIGGPCMIRAAAKNWRHVLAAAGSHCLGMAVEAVERGTDDEVFRRLLASMAFETVSSYDLLVSINLESGLAPGLRYGENPHQHAWAHFRTPGRGFGAADLLCGESLSYNNYLDSSAAWDLAMDMPGNGYAAILLKHGNPCGAGTGSTGAEAFENAFRADRASPYGGILAVRGQVDLQLVQALKGLFLEVLLAGSYTDEAILALGKRKKLRVLRMPPGAEQDLQFRSIWGGVLVQEPDPGCKGDLPGTVVTKRSPTPLEATSIEMAWRICRCVKSNSMVIADGKGALGIGAGQMSRIESLELAVGRAGKAGLSLCGSALGSDGFIPFRDCVDEAARAGVTAVAQPGGSIRDEEAIEAADGHGMAMVFTSRRHFRH